MMEMGIPKHKAEIALTETGNVGVEVATEWLFSTPDTSQFEQYTSDTGEQDTPALWVTSTPGPWVSAVHQRICLLMYTHSDTRHQPV
jgi:hypothetical protein